MLHNWELCERRADAATARHSAACFCVSFFAPEWDSLIRCSNAGLQMVNGGGCRSHCVLALTVHEPLSFAHPLKLS
jgi:hypothetical protein